MKARVNWMKTWYRINNIASFSPKYYQGKHNMCSGALDSDFCYPAGYRIYRIVKENPAGYHNIQLLITLINKPFSVLPKIIARMRNC